jgi:hypothetical protein
VDQGAEAAARLAAAHRALRTDGSIQFRLDPQPPPSPPPAWLRTFFHGIGDLLRPVGRAISWAANRIPDGPYARILLWSVLAAGAACVILLVARRFRDGLWSFPFRRRKVEGEAEPQEQEWQPEPAPARSWLKEADALAAERRFAEAVHHLLFRSIEDLSRRRPQLVRPALTSRELAAAEAVPTGARALFARIAAPVERSLFGGRPVGEDDWAQARDAYAQFVRPGHWRG